MHRLILEKAGYRVATATEPGQALAMMQEQRPDLVISDLMMTSLDSGFSLARSVKSDERFSDIPIIISTSVCTALGLDFEPRSESDMAQMHIDAYFNKPLDPSRLLSKIEELLARRGRSSS